MLLYFPTDPLSIVLGVVMLISGFVFFYAEYTGTWNLGYSKFSDPKSSWGSLPSKVGMTILYVPAAIIYPICFFVFSTPYTGYHILLAVLFIAHFLKRTLECQFLHRFSGVTNTASALLIGFATYGGFAVMASYCASTISANQVETVGPNYLIGVLIFLIGESINLYHHYLLTTLRTNDNDKSYRIPKGGLFKYVTCPHYFGELIAWLGFALIYVHWFAWCGLLCSSLYLMGRSHQTVNWYQTKLGKGALPHGWKRLFPFIY